MAPIKKFSRTINPLEAEFKPLPLTEDQLTALNTESERVHALTISAQQKFFRLMEHLGGMELKHGTWRAIPGKYEQASDELDQLSKWRARKFPFDQRVAYERWSRQHRGATGAYSDPAAKAVAHDQAMRDLQNAAEEINVDDIPF